jgi:hypothetical protein
MSGSTEHDEAKAQTAKRSELTGNFHDEYEYQRFFKMSQTVTGPVPIVLLSFSFTAIPGEKIALTANLYRYVISYATFVWFKKLSLLYSTVEK